MVAIKYLKESSLKSIDEDLYVAISSIKNIFFKIMFKEVKK